MNAPACRAQKRHINKDLSKIFPGGQGPHCEYQLASEIFQMVGSEGVAYVVTLHESWNLHDTDTGKRAGCQAQGVAGHCVSPCLGRGRLGAMWNCAAHRARPGASFRAAPVSAIACAPVAASISGTLWQIPVCFTAPCRRPGRCARNCRARHPGENGGRVDGV